MINEELYLFTGPQLLWEFWEDYKRFADEDTTFEEFAPEIKEIKGNKIYQTNSMLTYFEEVDE